MKRPRFLQLESSESNSLQSLRLQILNLLLIGASLVSTLIFIPIVIGSVRGHLWGGTAGYALIYAWLLVITFIPRIRLGPKIYSFLSILYFMGMVNFIQSGVRINAGLFLMAFSVMASLFLGTRGAVISLVISVFTLGIMGGFTASGNFPIHPQINEVIEPRVWLVTTGIYTILATAVTISLISLVRGLENSLLKEQDLANDLEHERQQLRQQTDSLEQREAQIRTAAEISRAISAVLEPDLLIEQVVNLIQQRFDLYYVGVFLITSGRWGNPLDSSTHENDNSSAQYAVLRAGTGEAGKRLVAAGHKLAVGGESMIGWTTYYRQPRIALDVGNEAVRFSNPYLPDTHSELALPLISHEKVLGALTIQSQQIAAFDTEDISILQAIADSLATALENARLFQEVQANLDEIRALNRQYVLQSWSELTPRAEEFEYTYKSKTENMTDAIEPAANAVADQIDIPFTLREQVIGHLRLERERPGLSSEERSFIEAVTTQAALALENARLLEVSQRRAAQERVTTNITSKIWASTEIETILQTTLQELGRSLRISDGLIELGLNPVREIER